MVGRVLLPLRAFLGITFCFAGLQKLANPKFFDSSDPASIQSQLAGAVRLSPIHALISPLTHVAVALGVLIACSELAIGVATLLGLWARLAAIGGLLLSFTLFLTVSFHASPYYTGSDIVFVFAWTPLVVAGAGSVLSLDYTIEQWADNQVRAHRHGARTTATAEEISRREVSLKTMATAAAGVATLVIGGLGAGLGRLVGGTNGQAVPKSLSGGTGHSHKPSASPKPRSHPRGTAIGRASQVPVGQAATFQDPQTGN